jgi:hypothetical protein
LRAFPTVLQVNDPACVTIPAAIKDVVRSPPSEDVATMKTWEIEAAICEGMSR